MKKSRVWQAIVPGTQNKPQDTLQIRKTPWHGVTKQPPAVPLPGPNVTPEPNLCPGQTSLLNRMKKSRVWQAIVPGTQNKPQDTLQIRKTPWHGVTKQPPAVPLPGPNVTPEPNEKIKGLAGNCSRHTKQATRHPSNQENTLARRNETASCPEPNEKKSRVWQAIVPGTQTKPQDTLQIRKTPWHGVTKQPPAVPLPGPNVTPEPNEKIKGLAGNCSRHTKQATRHPSNQENTLARRDETFQAHKTEGKNKVQMAGNCSWHLRDESLCPGQTSLLNRMKKSRVWQAIVPGTQNKPQDTLQIRKTPWHGVTKQPPAVPLPGPNVTPEPNEKINQGSGRQLFQAHKTSHKTPFKSGNTLARRDETASCRPSARAKRHS